MGTGDCRTLTLQHAHIPQDSRYKVLGAVKAAPCNNGRTFFSKSVSGVPVKRIPPRYR